MSKKQAKKWSLDPKEVTWGMHGSSGGKSGQFERKLKRTSSTVFLTHLPTDTKVEGEVPDGHYSKKEMQLKRDQLRQTLFWSFGVSVKLRISQKFKEKKIAGSLVFYTDPKAPKAP